MGTESLNRSLPKRPDVLSALISNLAVIIQIIAVGSIGLANVLKINSYFKYQDLVTLANFIILLISFSFIGLYNFHRSNKDFIVNPTESPGFFRKIWEFLFGKTINTSFNNSADKKLLRFLFLFLVISVFIFFYLSFKTAQENMDLSFWEGVFQLVTYMIALTTSSILIYIWIRDSFDKSNLFTESNFIPNLRSVLIEYGFIKTPTIIVHKNISLENSNRLLEVTTEKNKKYFIVSYDGNKIHAELNDTQYNQLLNSRQQS